MKTDAIPVSCELFEEPSLQFAADRLHLDPKRGITLFGPRSLDMGSRHPDAIRVAFIGGGESIESARTWIEQCADGVAGDDKNYMFPGFHNDRGYFSELSLEEDLVEKLTVRELETLTKPRTKRERFEETVALLGDKLRLLAQRDRPPDYVVLALPTDLVRSHGRVDYFDKEAGDVHRDLRRAIKAVAMRHRLPTQILLQRTTEAPLGSKSVDHRSKCAWNFFNGLYYKSGGIPWVPHGLGGGTCYVGVSFHRVPGTRSKGYFTGLAQAFDELGNGLVLRGQDFMWDSEKLGNSPHMPEDVARELIATVLKRYRDECIGVLTAPIRAQLRSETGRQRHESAWVWCRRPRVDLAWQASDRSQGMVRALSSGLPLSLVGSSRDVARRYPGGDEAAQPLLTCRRGPARLKRRSRAPPGAPGPEAAAADPAPGG